MEVSLISDTLTTIDHPNNSHALGFANFFTRPHSFTLSSTDQQRQLDIYAQIWPIDAAAPPTVKPRTIPKTHTRKRSRVRKKLRIDGFGADDGVGFFGGNDGPFGGAGGGGAGGGGGNFHGFNSDESSSCPPDPAFDFVYEALSWFVLSNCLLFAFKRVARIVADGVADPVRD